MLIVASIVVSLILGTGSFLVIWCAITNTSWDIFQLYTTVMSNVLLLIIGYYFGSKNGSKPNLK